MFLTRILMFSVLVPLLSACGTKILVLEEPVTPPAEYCSTTSVYGSPITATGTAYYAYRENGNGDIADGGWQIGPTAAVVNGATYSITISGTTFSKVATSTSEFSLASALVALINANASIPMTASVLKVEMGATDAYYVLVKDKVYGTNTVPTHSVNLSKFQHTAPRPIRYAEVVARDSSGNIVQCAATDGSGFFTMNLPLAASGTYTISVNSRILNSTKARVYVLNNHYDNVHYSVSTTVSATANSANNNIVAAGEGTLEGGAFNILDQLIKANEFLKTYVSAADGCGGATFSDCTPFTAAPISYVYWAKGVNPYRYFGSSVSASFYVGDSMLFILGGDDEVYDFDEADSDHFDNSVIVHEYGHFLADVYSTDDSPGGYHDASFPVDPRLGWSEGFADFFQAAVTGSPVYRDTEGNNSGGGSVLINADLESGTDGNPTVGGEGFFKEFSIARLLWDAIDPHPDTNNGSNEAIKDNITTSMTEIWNVFAGTTSGLKSTLHRFRHMGTFLQIQDSVNGAGSTDWGTLRTAEKQNGNSTYDGIGFREYANPITAGGVCDHDNDGNQTEHTIITLNPALTSSDDGSFNGRYYSPFWTRGSDQIRNNDFYNYYHNGGSLSVQLTYDTADYNIPPNLDLYIYPENYRYGSFTAGSEGLAPTTCVSNNADCVGITESVNPTLAAGYYLINVKAKTGGGADNWGAATYQLTINGQTGCPGP